MQLENRKVLVVGLGRSGVASANFLLSRRARVTVTDGKDAARLGTELAQLKGPVSLALGGHDEGHFLEAELIVISPGVPAGLVPLEKARLQGIPVVGEVELACRFLQGRFIGVTGSNGKTTTTTLIGELLRGSGRPCVVAGNIGEPLIRFAEGSRPEGEMTYVVELSSFQLETIERLHCHIALVLNVTPDHLDRYRSLEDYALAKERIFLNQGENDFAVLNADNPLSLKMAEGRRSRVFPFSRERVLEEGVFVDSDRIVICRQGTRLEVMPASEVRLKGRHNLENALAATAAGFLAGLEGEPMAEVFRSFAGVEHRLEFVRRLDDVEFYNDSKATNVDSAVQALRAFDRPIVAIMGGRDKGGDFASLAELVAAKVRLLVLLGEAGEKIEAALGGVVPVVRARDMAEAVGLAYLHASAGEVVVLTPACASFDMFEDYEHRGRVFKQCVARLKPGRVRAEGRVSL